MLIGWLQEVIASDCNGLLGAVAYLLSHCISAISNAAQQYRQPSSAHVRPVLQDTVLELEEQCASLQMAAVSMLRCLREHALRSCLDAHKLLPTLERLLLLHVMPSAACANRCFMVQLMCEHHYYAPGSLKLSQRDMGMCASMCALLVLDSVFQLDDNQLPCHDIAAHRLRGCFGHCSWGWAAAGRKHADHTLPARGATHASSHHCSHRSALCMQKMLAFHI